MFPPMLLLVAAVVVVVLLLLMQGVKNSSINGNRYLAYLWELGELPVYIIGGLAYSVSQRYNSLSMVKSQGIYTP